MRVGPPTWTTCYRVRRLRADNIRCKDGGRLGIRNSGWESLSVWSRFGYASPWPNTHRRQLLGLGNDAANRAVSRSLNCEAGLLK